MPKRKTSNGLAARFGSLFGKKPERHVTPHIYISTEKETKERKAKAKVRAAKAKVARQAAAAALSVSASVKTPAVETAQSNLPAKGVGKLMKVKAPGKDAPPTEDANALKEEEGFMQRVHLQKKDTAPRKGIGLWSLVRDRFHKAPAMTKASTEKADAIEFVEEVAASAPVQASTDKPVGKILMGTPQKTVRTEMVTPQESSAPVAASVGPSALDEVVSGVTAKKQEVAKAVQENADIKEEKAPVVPAKLPDIQNQKRTAPQKVKVQQFKKRGFKAFLASLGYIGMGKEKAMFIQNMATMLNAGLPLTDSLHTMVLETRNKPMRKLVGRIIDMVENGSPLWRAMEAQNFFSLHALALVRIGEEAGDLAENMGYLAEQDEKDNALRSKVKMAMIYPTIVLSIMFVIVIGLGTFVLPNLIGVLFALNVELPAVTRAVIWCSNMFTQHGLIGVPSFIGGFILIIILSKFTKLRVVTQWVMFKVPGVGRLAREATIARFGVILGGLLKAGVPVVEALQSLVQVTPIAAYKNLYAQMLARVVIGDSFSKCFASIKGSQKLLPPSVQQLVITGEKSGSLADIMLKISDIYDKKATETAEKLPIILEPLLLLFIGALVGTIAFAIIIPIYSIVGNVQGA